MADVFISYKREDRDRIAPLAKAIEACGYTVWWDLDLIAGQRWDKMIKVELDSAGCVVVAWTQNSIAADRTYVSTWVGNEADEAEKREILIPALLDAGRIAWSHSKLQYADLTDWRGEPSSKGFLHLITGIERLAGPRSLPWVLKQKNSAQQPLKTR